MEDVHIADAQCRVSNAELYPAVIMTGRTEKYENLDTRNQQTFNTIGNEVVGGNQSAWRAALSLSGQYYISHWYKKRYEVRYYEELRDSAVHDCEAAAKKLIKEVTDIFGGIVEAKIKLHYSTEILQRLFNIAELKKQALALGQLSYEDVLKAQSNAFSMEKEITVIQKELKAYFARLSSHTGNCYDENSEVIHLMPEGRSSIAGETKIITATPEYQARVKELEAVRAKEKSVVNNFLPDISIYGRYDFYNTDPNGIDKAFNDVRQAGYSAGLLISFPLFDGGVRKWERRRNLYEIRKREEIVWAAYAEKNKDIKTLQTGYDELNKSYLHYKKLREQYVKLTAISRKAYFLGERSNLDMLELEKDALLIERDIKVVENSLAVYEKKLVLETDYKQFVSVHDGDWTCKY